MIKTLGLCALLAVAALPAACGFDIFEDIGSDPHPPTVQITSLEYYVAPPPEVAPTPTAAGAANRGRTIDWDSGGFSVSPGQRFVIGRAYSDAGGDILKFHVRDRDGAFETDITPTDQTYYTGTSGTVIGPEGGLELTGIAGPHRLELWAEDSHGSRSEKVAFVITLVL